jgi:hypothetical protein
MPVAMQRLTAMVANRLGEHRTLPLFLESLEIRQSVTSGKALLIFRGPYQPGHQAKVFLEGFLRISDVAGCLFEPFACKGKGKGIPKNSRVVEGQDYLTNSYRDLTLQIGARSFMQPNWPVFESIGRVLLEWIGDLQGGQRVLELYAGIGALGLSLARQGALTTLVETNPFALADGRSSASMNHVRSCRFKGMSAEKFLASSKPNEYDVLVVDPPRIGLSPLVIQEMGRVQSPRLYYLSCDAPTLARDLAQLCSFGYQVTRIQPFDMFPQTAHIETLVELVMGNA